MSELTWRGTVLLVMVVPAWVVGAVLSVRAAPVETAQRSSIAVEIRELASLKPHVTDAREVDYLMDLDPGSGRHPGEVLRGRRFKAQYALAPALVTRRRARHHAVRHASRVLAQGRPYVLVWDPRFHSSLGAVLEDLGSVARDHQASVEVHRGQGELAVVVVRRD